jgi:hypothetical protein
LQRELIDTSFRKLRSAEGAFELLSNFRSIESRGAIQQQMMNKLVDILEQFHREIGAAQVRGRAAKCMDLAGLVPLPLAACDRCVCHARLGGRGEGNGGLCWGSGGRRVLASNGKMMRMRFDVRGEQ